MKASDWIMCGYVCIGLISSMLKGKNLLSYIKLVFLKKFHENDKIILKYFRFQKFVLSIDSKKVAINMAKENISQDLKFKTIFRSMENLGNNCKN